MRARRSAGAALVALVAVLGLAGCVMPPEEARPYPSPIRTRSATPRGGATASASPSAEPAATPTVTTPTAGPTRSAAPRSTPTPGASTRPPAADLTLVVNGDLLWHNTLWASAREDARRAGRRGFDFAPMLAGLRPVVAGADLAICHEEPPIAPAGGPYANYPRFSVPPSVVPAIKATGYDACSTASNHSVDHGFGGLKRTLDALDRAGIAHAGTARTAAEARRPTTVTTADGVEVGLVSGTFSLNGMPRPAGKPWSVTGLDPAGLLDQAHRARAAGADVVVVALHAGTEFSSRVDDQQRRLARVLTASPDVDLVYMHHTHVVQPWQRVNGKWVIYGLGNTVADHRTEVPQGSEGVTARLRFVRGKDGRYAVAEAEYIPTFVTRYAPGRPARVYPISAVLPRAKGATRARLALAQRRTTAVVNRYHPVGLRRA